MKLEEEMMSWKKESSKAFFGTREIWTMKQASEDEKFIINDNFNCDLSLTVKINSISFSKDQFGDVKWSLNFREVLCRLCDEF